MAGLWKLTWLTALLAGCSFQIASGARPWGGELCPTGLACVDNQCVGRPDGAPEPDARVMVDAAPLPDGGIADAEAQPDGPPGCGDLAVGVNEECDDGNRTDTDGCTNLCKFAVC